MTDAAGEQRVEEIRKAWESNVWDDRHLACHKAIGVLLARLRAVEAFHEQAVNENEGVREKCRAAEADAQRLTAEVARLRDVVAELEDRDEAERIEHERWHTQQEKERADAAETRVRALEAALEWYAERAQALERYLTAKPPKTEAVTAVVTELGLDKGERARAALTPPRP